MSTARSRKLHRQRGFTVPEIAFSLVILALLTYLAERTLTGSHDAERLLKATRNVTEKGHRVSFEVFDAVSASRKLYQRDTVGEDYLDALDLTRAPRAVDTRLPLIDETGELGPDAVGDPRTGNVLLFVQEGDPIACVSDAATGDVRYIDVYQFVCVYPSVSTRVVVPEDGPALDLVVWRSTMFPSLPQLLAVEDTTERESVVRDLAGRHGHEHAWDPTQGVADAFHAIDDLGTIAGTADPDPTIPEDVEASGRGRLVYANVQLSRTDPDVYLRRAVFTAAETPAWAPDGFEVKIAGASGSRKVWIHVVVSAPASRSRVVYHPSTMIASARDL